MQSEGKSNKHVVGIEFGGEAVKVSLHATPGGRDYDTKSAVATIQCIQQEREAYCTDLVGRSMMRELTLLTGRVVVLKVLEVAQA